MRDPRSGRVIAAVTSPFYGPKILFADDPAGEWAQAEGVALPEGGDQALERIWVIVAGEAATGRCTPAAIRACCSRAATAARPGSSTARCGSTRREDWQPGGGGLCLHSIVPWPGEPDRLAVAVSAAGVWLTDDGGRDVAPRQPRASRPRYLPDDAPEDSVHALRAPTGARAGAARADVHAVPRRRVPLRRRRRVAGPRSAPGCRRTSASRWRSTRRPRQRVRDPAHRRHGPGDARRPRARVRDARRAARPGRRAATGLPAEHAYLTVLRQAFDRARRGRRARALLRRHVGRRVRLGRRRRDAGSRAATRLPPVFSVTAVA